ncbi:hypothetical protein EVAR_17036_1 [Eumeta japonica]|uniref:Uncharacterized protein n=1 Tax=Eumeta variegata TaxID=151549 RepID=A0A4C1V5C5_EUMVA|nr:hypothetical protein EVAR_17036_1 [Eumeta japonica]
MLASNTNEDDTLENRDFPVHTRSKDAALKTSIFKTSYRAAMAKARATWNLQSRNTVVSDSIKSELGKKLFLPNTRRWKSTYDALVVLNTILETKRPAIHRDMIEMNLPPFNDQNVAIMKEYVKMHRCAPLANALLSGIKKRFERFMEDEVCQLAAAFHSKFRLVWLQKYENRKFSIVRKLIEAKVENALIKEREAIGKDNISIS